MGGLPSMAPDYRSDLYGGPPAGALPSMASMPQSSIVNAALQAASASDLRGIPSYQVSLLSLDWSQLGRPTRAFLRAALCVGWAARDRGRAGEDAANGPAGHALGPGRPAGAGQPEPEPGSHVSARILVFAAGGTHCFWGIKQTTWIVETFLQACGISNGTPRRHVVACFVTFWLFCFHETHCSCVAGWPRPAPSSLAASDTVFQLVMGGNRTSTYFPRTLDVALIPTLDCRMGSPWAFALWGLG